MTKDAAAVLFHASQIFPLNSIILILEIPPSFSSLHLSPPKNIVVIVKIDMSIIM